MVFMVAVVLPNGIPHLKIKLHDCIKLMPMLWNLMHNECKKTSHYLNCTYKEEHQCDKRNILLELAVNIPCSISISSIDTTSENGDITPSNLDDEQLQFCQKRV